MRKGAAVTFSHGTPGTYDPATDTTTGGNQAFTFVGNADPKLGQLGMKSFGNINAAENALGFDIDGLDGKGANSPVTVLFGNNDADAAPDFALVLNNTASVNPADLFFG